MPCFKIMYKKLPGDPENNRENITYGSLGYRGFNQQFQNANQEHQPLHRAICEGNFI